MCYILGTLFGASLDQILNVRGSVFGCEAPEGVKDRAVSGAPADVTVEDLFDLSSGRRRVVSSEARKKIHFKYCSKIINACFVQGYSSGLKQGFVDKL